MSKNDLSSDSLPFDVDLVLNIRYLDKKINLKLKLGHLIVHLLTHFQKHSDVSVLLETQRQTNEREKVNKIAQELPQIIHSYYSRHYDDN